MNLEREKLTLRDFSMFFTNICQDISKKCDMLKRARCGGEPEAGP